MNNLEELVEEAIAQVKKGIDDFNAQSPQTKASYPECINFDVTIPGQNEGNRIKMTVPITHRPWEK